MSGKENAINTNSIYQALFESAAEGLVVTDKRGVIIAVNTALLEMFGYDREEIIGQRVDMLVPAPLRSSHDKQRKGYMEKPSPRAMGNGRDLMGERKDGSLFPVEISLNHINVEGEGCAMALVSDISERKGDEEALQEQTQKLELTVRQRTSELKESERLYALIARQFPNGTINVLDREFKYLFAEGKEFFKHGVTSETLIGTNFIQRLGPAIQEDTQEKLEQVFAGQHLSFHIQFGDQHYEINCVPLENAEGVIDKILVVEHNVTTLTKAKQEAQVALEREQELGELKSRFVSMASHEFRTPLATVLSSANLLERYLQQPEVNIESCEKHTRRIKGAVSNLTGILNDFLSLDKLESGLIASNPVDLDVLQLGNDVVDEMSANLKSGQTINFTNEGLEDTMRFDRQIIHNVMLNLVSNAIKYSPEGSVIRFSAVRLQNHLEIEVEDQGMGIPKSDQKHLFDRFFRATNATNIQGTGLGLHIVAKYIEFLGGTIRFESEEEKGTTFYVSLPIANDR